MTNRLRPSRFTPGAAGTAWGRSPGTHPPADGGICGIRTALPLPPGQGAQQKVVVVHESPLGQLSVVECTGPSSSPSSGGRPFFRPGRLRLEQTLGRQAQSQRPGGSAPPAPGPGTSPPAEPVPPGRGAAGRWHGRCRWSCRSCTAGLPGGPPAAGGAPLRPCS